MKMRKAALPEFQSYPQIDLVPEATHRPFWSVMIPTYNCTQYLGETLRSVLEQAPGREDMQIEVVDDCSPQDDPAALVSEIGDSRVSFFRQPENVGATANFNTCIRRARGYVIHILHGDDFVRPGFYDRLQMAFEEEPTIGAAFCRCIYMDGEGHWQTLSNLEKRHPGVLRNWLERIACMQRIQTPSIVVKRAVYEELGGFHPELFHAADWEMWKRIAAHFPVWYEPRPLACYRQHDSSDTSELIRSGANIADIRKSIRISRSYLPQSSAAELSDRALEHYALYALQTARRVLAKGDRNAVSAQLQEAMKCSSSLRVIVSALRFLSWATVRWVYLKACGLGQPGKDASRV